MRGRYLLLFLRCCKLRYPDVTEFLGLAFNHPALSPDPTGESLASVYSPSLSQEEHAYLQEAAHALGFFKKVHENPYKVYEFPPPPEGSPPSAAA